MSIGATSTCPHPGCGKEIYVRFVEVNGKCAACGKPLAVESTTTGPQFFIPEPAPAAAAPQSGD